MLYDDMKPVIFDGPTDTDHIHIYAIGDAHVGAPNWDPKITLKKMETILADQVGFVHLCGDLMNNGLKNSKTNTYMEMMSPREQKAWIIDNLAPLAPRIISAVPGNHEDRTTRETDISPMYDIMAIWDIPERYRENLALSVVRFGVGYNNKPTCYGGLTTHGSSRNKHSKFITGFDGIDYAISGHTHTPTYSPRGKVRLNVQRGTASHVGYHEIVVDSGIRPGDYGLKKEYEIPTPARLEFLTLHVATKEYRHPQEKRIDFNSIQI